MYESIYQRVRPKEAEFESLLVDVFRHAGWKVMRQPKGPDRGIDLVVDSGEKKYIIELKRSSEGRGDRLLPLLSQAILQAQVAKQRFSKPAVSVAIVAADRIPESVGEQLKDFARKHAPDVAVGIVDLEGFRAFQGFGLEQFNADRQVSPSLGSPSHSRLPVRLFSDLNQWMLKILLAPRFSESLLSAPREKFQSAAQLARAASVSVMSASRFVRQLSNEGFLDDHRGPLKVVRIEELLERWRAASHKNAREIPARWILRGSEKQLRSALNSYVSRIDAESLSSKRPRKPQRVRSLPRICVGLFEAAELLGVGFVRGVAPHIYVERLEAEALEQLRLSVGNVGRNPDVLLRIPENPESLFRPVVRRDGIPVSDIIQVWLDVANHPARGKEQAEQIWKKVLAPAVRSGSDARS
ncbi:MAG: restriction endonuclease [Acidobacteriia bacterium]|nr:restriction endonuclease [Terriglobia bacterium]